jgi:transposase InsO family protein
MAWKETDPMLERLRFIEACARQEETVADLCRRFGVSRKVGYKWLDRWREEGLEGLSDRSRAPHHHCNATPQPIIDRLIAFREAHKSWGPKKILAWLERNEPRQSWPAASTIGGILKAAGQVPDRRLRHRVPARTQPFASCAGSNDVWAIDWKGWFCTANGERCEPLTISDAYSRYLIRCQALPRSDGEHAWPVIEAAFFECGLPKAMRSDNGPPFASRGVGRLSRLAVKLIKAGVVPEWIDPGAPQQNGRHERLHLTLKQDTAMPPAYSVRAQNRRFAAFQRIYNEERPHEALGQRTPAQVYQCSPRRYDGRLREPHYPDEHSVRRVRSNGQIKWRGELLFLGEALVGEPVGLEPIEQDRCLVRFGPIELAVLDASAKQLRLIVPSTRRRRQACGFVDIAGGQRRRFTGNQPAAAISTTPQAQQPQQPSCI